MVDAVPGEGSSPPGPVLRTFDAGEWRTRAAGVSTRREFGELISEVAAAARISIGAVKAQLDDAHVVYGWFTGRSLPRSADDAGRLADTLERALARRYPGTEVAAAIVAAWQRLADLRREEAARRAVANRRAGSEGGNLTPAPAAEPVVVPALDPAGLPGDGFGSGPANSAVLDPPEAMLPATSRADQPAEPPRDREPVRRRPIRSFLRRRAAAVLAVVAVVAGTAGGFGVTRAMVGPPSYRVLPCAESVSVNPEGSVRMYLLDGPPGAAWPRQHSELRMQIEDSVGWIAYAVLTQPITDRDRVRLDWSDVEDPDDSQVRHCDAQWVNQVWKTVGVRTRNPLGGARWFRACGTVPDEFRAAGRGPTACGSWVQADD